jgi:hypothetical protein
LDEYQYEYGGFDMRVMYGKDEVSARIRSGARLLLAGDEQLLSALPAGEWIGGTIPYFMAEQGGECNREKVYVTELPDYVEAAEIKVYDAETLANVYTDAPDNGFSFIIIPATSNTHLTFALKAPEYENFAMRPLVGWISGVYLDDLGNIAPKVFDGSRARMLQDNAVVMHVTLSAGKVADLGIINIFEPGDGDVIEFLEDGFSASEVMINVEKKLFSDYIKEKDLDVKLPLVADYYGAKINTSFQAVDHDNRKVDFYAPVFAGKEYRHAGPVGDYVSSFKSQMPRETGHMLFTCNCILNYLFSELEGRQTGGITGPITFGEIAYQLLNQTLVYVTVHDV